MIFSQKKTKPDTPWDAGTSVTEEKRVTMKLNFNNKNKLPLFMV